MRTLTSRGSFRGLGIDDARKPCYWSYGARALLERRHSCAALGMEEVRNETLKKDEGRAIEHLVCRSKTALSASLGED
jgi:hypothetical protein